MADLITLDDYKAFEAINGDKEDIRLTETIGSVSALVRAYCNNSFTDFVSVDKVQVFNIPRGGLEDLYLKETPLISITSVAERTSFSASYNTLNSSDYYYILDSDSLVRMKGDFQIKWPEGPGSVIITYKAGYLILPEDLKLAVANLCTHYWKEYFKTASKNIASSSLTTTFNNTSDMPGHIKRVLDLYRSIL